MVYEISQECLELIAWFFNSAKIDRCGAEEARKITSLQGMLEIAVQKANAKAQEVAKKVEEANKQEEPKNDVPA